MQESRILQKLLHHNKCHTVGPRTPAPGNLCQLNSLSWAVLTPAEVQMLVNRCSANQWRNARYDSDKQTHRV